MSWEAWGDPPDPLPDCKVCEGDGNNPVIIMIGSVEFLVLETCDSCGGKGYISDDIHFEDDVL